MNDLFRYFTQRRCLIAITGPPRTGIGHVGQRRCGTDLCQAARARDVIGSVADFADVVGPSGRRGTRRCVVDRTDQAGTRLETRLERDPADANQLEWSCSMGVVPATSDPSRGTTVTVRRRPQSGQNRGGFSARPHSGQSVAGRPQPVQ